MQLLPILFGLILIAVYHYTNKLNIKKKSYYHNVMSFSAGVSITYLLLELFPLFTEKAQQINRLLFVSVLLGFIVHHMIEKNIYQHNKDHDLEKLLSLEENIFSFIYHVIVGILLVTFTLENILQGLLYFIPVMSFVFVSTLPTRPHKNKYKSFFLGSSTFIGVLLATFLWTSWSPIVITTLIGLVLGVMLFTVIRHHLPFGRAGRISYFAFGFIIYSLLIIGSWYV
jgi:hypothetical protein